MNLAGPLRPVSGVGPAGAAHVRQRLRRPPRRFGRSGARRVLMAPALGLRDGAAIGVAPNSGEEK